MDSLSGSQRRSRSTASTGRWSEAARSSTTRTSRTLHALGGAAKGMVENQLSKINPILDARQFPLDAILNRIEILEGRLTIYGSISPLYSPTIGA